MKLRLGLLLAAGAVAAIAAVLLVRSWTDDDATILSTDLIAARAELLPQTHDFGDPVLARVDVLVDHAFVDPDSLRLEPTFAPYRISRRPEPERSEIGTTTRVRYEFVLSCLQRACLPKGASRQFEFPPGQLSYVITEIGERQTTSFEWIPIDVSSRLGTKGIEQALRADALDVPPVSYRVSPHLVAGLALALGGLLTLAALALIAPLLPLEALSRRLRARRASRRSAVARALALVRDADARERQDELRRALERLSRELRGVRSPELARDARRLAWSEDNPPSEGVGALSTEVERTIGKEA